ncbi:MAG: FAD binding domain-containing protein, partial [Pseudomonadota bacterium]
MYAFNYEKPGAVADAERQLRDLDDPKLLAGGQTLIPTMKQRLAMPSDLIDIADIADLKGIAVEGDRLVVGAAEKHADVAASETVRGAIPALAHLASGIGDPHVRHRGTMGGSLANNDPSACYPAACLGLGATIH